MSKQEKKQTDYFYDAVSGNMFFDREHKHKIMCVRHVRTQLTFDPIRRESCRRCASFGFAVNLWNLKARIAEFKNKEYEQL